MLTVKQAAQRLGLSERRVIQLLHCHKLRGEMTGGRDFGCKRGGNVRWLVYSDYVERWANHRETWKAESKVRLVKLRKAYFEMLTFDGKYSPDKWQKVRRQI
jgi:excisionase family DNA binding protein